MSTGHWTDRLSDYLDGELSPVERIVAERHISECPECAALLAELSAVVSAAGELRAPSPPGDLWPGIRARLTPRGSAAATEVDEGVARLDASRRISMTIPELMAAGIAVALVSASLVWTALGGPVVVEDGVVASDAAPPGQVVLAAYQPAMSELEAAYELRRDDLDPETILVVERNLAIIDAAIREAGQALEADPSSGFLHTHLAETVRQRMALLRQVASI